MPDDPQPPAQAKPPAGPIQKDRLAALEFDFHGAGNLPRDLRDPQKPSEGTYTSVEAYRRTLSSPDTNQETKESAVSRGIAERAYALDPKNPGSQDSSANGANGASASSARAFPVDKYPLSAEQLAVANVLLDFSDTRTHAAKLKSLGVPSTKYNNWLRQPAFSAYCRERAESLIDNTGQEAHVSLLKQVQSGRSLEAVKYYNQLTGRFTPGQEAQANIAGIMVRIVEIVQRHVQDPEVIREIAREFSGLGVGADSKGPVEPRSVESKAS